MLTEFTCLYFLSDSGELYLICISLMYDYDAYCAFLLCDGCFHSVIDLQALFAFRMHSHNTHMVGGILLNHISLICMMNSNAECQNIAAGLLFVSMKPGSRDKVFLIWIDTAFMHDHNNLCFILQVSVANVLDCFRNHCSCSQNCTFALNSSSQILHKAQHSQADGSSKFRCARAKR